MTAAAAEALEGRGYLAGVGQGLIGEYYADPAFQSLAAARTDAAVNFAWAGSPVAGLPADRYSVRWSGQLLAPATGSFTLYGASAGGVRVRLGGQTVIDNWAAHKQVENKATVALTAGRYYPIQVDYREEGTGSVRLSWSGPSTPKQVVPKSQLYRVGSAPVAGGWLEGNVGTATGSVRGTSGSAFTLRGTGLSGGGSAAGSEAGPIGGTGDRFHYLYRAVRGNGVFVARANPIAAGGAEAGLVVRPDLNAGAAFAALTVSPAGVRFESRTDFGAAARSSAATPVAGPVYLKIVRDGNSYAGYRSGSGADGTWQLVGTAGVNMGTFQLFGLAAGSAAATPAAATFSAVGLRAVNPIGANLNSPSDRVQDLPFVDLVKTTRGFYNTAGRVAANGHAAFAETNAAGWPTEDFSFAAADNTEWGVPIRAGTYRLSFAGPAGVTVTAGPGVTLTRVGAGAAGDGPTTRTYEVAVGPGVLKLALTFAGTAGQVRDVRLLQPGYGPDDAPTFTDRYLDLIRATGPSVLRLMDFVQTNNNPTAAWADRTHPWEATQAKAAVPGGALAGRGVAWEYAVELANAVGRNVWVNVPAHADDDYVRHLADLLRTTLRPDLNIYLEDSNEVWNTALEQSSYNKTQAVLEVLNNPASDLNYDHRPVDRSRPDATNPQATAWGDRRHARRTKQIADIFRQSWEAGGEANPLNKRVRAVLAGQVAVLSRFDNELAYLNKRHGAPKNYLYALGIAPYFGLNKYLNATNATGAQVLEGLSRSVDSYASGPVFNDAFARAKAYGVRLIAKEGGPDTFGPLSIAGKRAASLDPQIQSIIARFVNTWYAHGGDLFIYYTVGARSYNSPFGTWSITEDLDVLDSPKIKAYQQVRDAYPTSTAVKGVWA